MRSGILETLVLTVLFALAIGLITIAASPQPVRVCSAKSAADSDVLAGIDTGVWQSRRLEE